MQFLDKKVSLFKSYRDTIPKEVILFDFLTSTKHKKQVIEIRNTKCKNDIARLKARLPAITPSGLFHTKRSSKNLLCHSGLIQIDIDAKDNLGLNMNNLKSNISFLDYVCFASFSVSGKGLFALVPISQPDKHLQHFLALEKDFKDINIIIDNSCKDVSRLRGYSYDPEYYINESSIIYNKIIELDHMNHKKEIAIYRKSSLIKKGSTFYKALKLISSNKIDITGDNQQWFSILCAIANEFGENGQDFAHLISKNSPLYDFERCKRDYERALSTNYNYGLGTMYYYLKEKLK